MAKVQYTRKQGAGLTYDIEADQYGRYTISLGGKVLKRGSEPLVTLRMLRPSPEREAEALDAACGAIDLLMGMTEQ